MAIHRAAHQIIDQPPVFIDPLAVQVLPPKVRATLEADPRQFERPLFGARLRAHLVARSRVAEDALTEAVARGVRQYVILGAGLDTFSWRNRHPDLHVFEVDHPSTQNWKRRVLQASGFAEPANVTFVPVDFERDALADVLMAAGLRADAPSFFSWLGVVPYLEKATVWKTLGLVSELAGAAGGIVFDYGAPPRPWNLVAHLVGWSFRRRLARVGEPLRTVLSPGEVARGLERLGFTTVRDDDHGAIVGRYFKGRGDRLRPGRLAHIVLATRAT